MLDIYHKFSLNKIISKITVLLALSSLTVLRIRSFRGQFRRHFSAMANPLIAVCQMTSTSDKEKNMQTVSELAAKAKSRSACVSIKDTGNFSYSKTTLIAYVSEIFDRSHFFLKRAITWQIIRRIR